MIMAVDLLKPKKNKMLRFVLIFGLSMIFWFIAYELYLKQLSIPDKYLTKALSQHVCMITEWTGKTCSYTDANKPGETYIFIEPLLRQTIRIGNSCNGLEIYIIFVLFIIAYPGRWQYKFPYIFGGLTIIYSINVLRTYWLTMMAYYKYPHYDIFHRYVFIVLVYGLVFSLWMIWANKYSNK
jgi:exosortase family protein XrtF